MQSVDTFVNGNPHNFAFAEADVDAKYSQYERNAEGPSEHFMELFESKIAFTSMDTQAAPVYVYINNGEQVAWYDEEMHRGYIA